MKSRYDYMTPSVVQDDDTDFYPDILSLNYDQGTLTKIPTLHKLTVGDLNKFWYYMWTKYGQTDMDDVLLNINGFPYIGILQPGDELYELAPEDLTGYITVKRLGEDDE
jgi:hypothetical protein